MSRKLQLRIPEPAAQALEELAGMAGQPVAGLASQLLQRAVANQARRNAPPATPAPSFQDSADTEAPERPAWLEPYGGDRTWRAVTWGAIAALHSRYPHQLRALQEDWWQDSAQLEQLSALAHWRAHLDEHATDPREELYFHDTLNRLARRLTEKPGTTGRWNANTIPTGWNI